MLPPEPGRVYAAFCDPAGGTGSDSYTMAITHRDRGRIVLDLVVSVEPPFNPTEVTGAFAQVLKCYRVEGVQADYYGAGFVVDAFRRFGIGKSARGETFSVTRENFQ